MHALQFLAHLWIKVGYSVGYSLCGFRATHAVQGRKDLIDHVRGAGVQDVAQALCHLPVEDSCPSQPGSDVLAAQAFPLK